MLEESILKLVHEGKRIADRLEMIHNHLAKFPETNTKLDEQLEEEELSEEAVIKKLPKDSKKASAPTKTVKEPSRVELVSVEEPTEEDSEVEEMLIEDESETDHMSEKELSAKCKAFLEAAKDQTAKARVRTLFVEVLKNTFGKDKTSELEEADRKTFVETLEKRIKKRNNVQHKTSTCPSG